ncbi:MAG: hypothetical protein WCT04_22945 [Planctomycetota bacterium]
MELFLSTSCDSFGGIVFITLMICLMPSKSTLEASAVPKGPSSSERAQLENVKNELSRKERVLEILKHSDGGLNSSEDSARLDELQRLENEERELRTAAALRGKEISELRVELDKTVRNHEFLRDASSRLKIGLTQVEKKDAAQSEVREARLPRLRKLNKYYYFLVVQNGKVYLTKRPGQNSLQVEFNDVDFKLTHSDRTMEFEPKPDKGVPVNDWLKAPDGVLALKRCLSKTESIVNIVIYPDSLPFFNAIRNAFTGSHYDYNWSPISPGHNLILVPDSGPKEAL